MEVGQAAARQHFANKSWESDREPLYSCSEPWKDRRAGGSSSWSSDAAAHAGQQTPPSSTSLSSLLPIIAHDGNVDKVLYHNLVEMIPLVETFMDQHSSKSFPRHASLIYTRSPSRDTWPLKQAVEHPSKGKKGRSQLVRGKKGELKDGLFWDNAENRVHENREIYSEEIPMLSFPTDHHIDQSAVNKAEFLQLQSQIEELEQKLQEKGDQLQATENNAQQIDLLRLQTTVEELQKQILEKEQAIQKGQDQVSQKQHEIVDLHALLQKSEAAVEASNLKLAEVKDELNDLRCEVAAFFFQMQSISSILDDDEDFDEPESSVINEQALIRTEDQVTSSQMHQWEAEQMELTRRKYLASLIAARENPSEELLSLVAELRAQLQGFLMRSEVPNAAGDLQQQSSRFSGC